MKLSNTTLIFMLTDRFATKKLLFWQIMWHLQGNVVYLPHGEIPSSVLEWKHRRWFHAINRLHAPTPYFKKLLKSHFICALDSLIVSAIRQSSVKKKTLHKRSFLQRTCAIPWHCVLSFSLQSYAPASISVLQEWHESTLREVQDKC